MSFLRLRLLTLVGESKYNPEEVTFAANFLRYEEGFFQKDCTTSSDEKKISLLHGKLGQSEHEKYTYYILPGEISLKKIVLILKKYSRRKVLYLTQDGSV